MWLLTGIEGSKVNRNCMPHSKANLAAVIAEDSLYLKTLYMWISTRIFFHFTNSVGIWVSILCILSQPYFNIDNLVVLNKTKCCFYSHFKCNKRLINTFHCGRTKKPDQMKQRGGNCPRNRPDFQCRDRQKYLISLIFKETGFFTVYFNSTSLWLPTAANHK